MRADWNDCINLSCFSDEPGESFQTSTSPKYGEDKYSKVARVCDGCCAVHLRWSGICGYVQEEGRRGWCCKGTGCHRPDEEEHHGITAGTANGSCVRMMTSARRWALTSAKRARSSSNRRAFAVMGRLRQGDRRRLEGSGERRQVPEFYTRSGLNQPGLTKYYIEYGEISTYRRL